MIVSRISSRVIFSFRRSINEQLVCGFRSVSSRGRIRIFLRTMATENNFLEITACKSHEMQNGEMKEVSFGDYGAALLIKHQDKFSAISNKCTHYNAPLIKGSLCNGHVRCPWHGACFNAVTGDIEDFPGLDSLQVFEVNVIGEDVVIKASKTLLRNGRRIKTMSKCTNSEGHGVVIVGGGGAAVTCAESLRQQGYSQKICILTKDNHPPYDRTKLSKDLKAIPSSIYLRDDAFFKNSDITVKCKTEVAKVDTSAKCVHVIDGRIIPYDKLLVAPGSTPRTLPIPGWELSNVFVLRNLEDAAQIASQANGKNAVVIGASFIGMEVASSLIGIAASVEVCEYFDVPYQTVLGPKVGKVFQSLHEERGIKFHMNASVTEFRGKNGVVNQVVLKNGTTLDADIVIAGVGVIPATKFLQGSGIELDKRGFIQVDKFLETNVKDVYAAGDVAIFPLKLRNWEPANVQHWQMAHYHGNLVGKNMVSGNVTAASSVPFFWSSLGPGKNLRYTGYGMGYDDIVISGSLSGRKFSAYYCKGDEVVALATFMMDPKASELAEKWRSGFKLMKREILDC